MDTNKMMVSAPVRALGSFLPADIPLQLSRGTQGFSAREGSGVFSTGEQGRALSGQPQFQRP